ncbi:hypothetical protein Tco_1342550 [Tanacetum coccineum]
MRFNEIYKFSDGTLTRILEALDYRVKEFKIKRPNLSMNTRFWTQKDVTRSKEFMSAIERRLKTRRIYRNLECFPELEGSTQGQNKGIVPTEMELELEQTQQEHPSDTYVFTMKMEILLEPISNKLMVDVPIKRTGKLGDSDVYTLEDPTLILEILSRRFFLRLNLPDHRSVLTGSGGSSKDGNGDTSIKVKGTSRTMNNQAFTINKSMSMPVQLSRAQDGEIPQVDDQRLDLADDLKKAQDHI